MVLNGKILPDSSPQLPCAVDTMGGDLGLGVQVEGAILAYKEFGISSVLVGPKDDLQAKLSALGGSRLPLLIRNATQVITMDDSPARAVRKKPDSSLCVAYQLVQRGEASAVISAGNSGAMMTAGALICGLFPGIERPAIATLIPRVRTKGAANVIIDSGANVDCHVQNLVQFALMGSVYFSSLFNIEQPRVALLSNGSEPSKGNDTTRGAALVLSRMEAMNYVGYIEGRDVGGDIADVIACDGFVGNVTLKALEGCVRVVLEQMIHEAKATIGRKIGLMFLRGMFKELFSERFDYAAHGGAPLLGLTKLAVVLHGSSDSRAVKNAIRVSDTFARLQMTENIGLALTRLDERWMDLGVSEEVSKS